MGAWKDEKKAAEALSGNITFPGSTRSYLALAAFSLVLAVAAAILVLRHRPPMAAPASQEGVPLSADSATAPGTRGADESLAPVAAAVNTRSPAAVASDVVILPPVTLPDKYARRTANKAEHGLEAHATKTRCSEEELEPTGGATSWNAAMASLEEARRVEESAGGDLAVLEKARKLYQQALDSGRLEEKEESSCLARLTELTSKIVLDPKVACSSPAAILHKVEPGDGVEKLARRYKVNQGQIKRINKLNDKLVIRFGETLKILPGDVFFKVNRTRLTGTLYIDGVFIRHYQLGIGPGDTTPRGTYRVERKVANPDWYVDGKRIPFGDPANILGTRWMAMSAADGSARGEGLGIHGTSKPETIPGRESKGCVRLLNSDAEELYDLMPQGGKVEITD